MKTTVCVPNFALIARRIFRLARFHAPLAILAGALLAHPDSALALLSFGRGTVSSVGSVQFASTPDSVILTGALIGPGVTSNGMSIHASRIQYDIIDSDQGTMTSWTINYSPAAGSGIIAAGTPLGYISSSGGVTTQGGVAYDTLFNAGFGVYNYNTGAPWSVDYEPDHITFTETTSPGGLPANDGEGYLLPNPYLPSFDILFNPDFAEGPVPATAKINLTQLTGQVLGPLPGNPCLTIQCTNQIYVTCSNCVKAFFSAGVTDTCCSSNYVVLTYSPLSGTCFPLDSTNTVVVVASDSCGNYATNYFTVTVLPGRDCGGNRCIDLVCSNIVAYTCDSCATVPYNATAVDPCCSSPISLTYNPPPTTCFPVNSTTPVEVTAFDQCGNVATNSFTVTVLPGTNCSTNCITISCSNIVAYTCANCAAVSYNAMAFDACCPASGVSALTFNPPETTCFPVNTTNVVEVTANDQCGNIATNLFTVAVLPAAGCGGTNCISIACSNIVAYTCADCTTVSYGVTALDPCCATAGAELTFNPPETTCFPVNSTTVVEVTAHDPCGNTATNSFTVSVLPGAGCATNKCIAIFCSNIVAYTCAGCSTVPFNVTAYDSCCGNPAGGFGTPTLTYNPPSNTCFLVNSTVTVDVTAYDACGNVATNSFTVTVLPGPNCGGNDCLAISCTNFQIVTCSNCGTAPYTAVVSDTCCAVPPTVVYNPPPNTCFPQNSFTLVQVTATDGCGNVASSSFVVSVIPAPPCGGFTNSVNIGNVNNPNGLPPDIFTLAWPGSNGQVQQSTDLIHWVTIPGATNPPYAVSKIPPLNYYRIFYSP